MSAQLAWIIITSAVFGIAVAFAHWLGGRSARRVIRHIEGELERLEKSFIGAGRALSSVSTLVEEEVARKFGVLTDQDLVQRIEEIQKDSPEVSYIGKIATVGNSQVPMVWVADGSYQWALPHYVLHSPDGFEWGYGGSGPADLARCLLIDALGLHEFAQHEGVDFELPFGVSYQDFKDKYVMHWERGMSWQIPRETIRTWAHQRMAAAADITPSNPDDIPVPGDETEEVQGPPYTKHEIGPRDREEDK